MGSENLIFVSGPQGAGKTTLMKKLQRYPQINFPTLQTKTKEFYWGDAYRKEEVNHSHRQCLKIAQRALENEEAHAIARQTNDIILGNRCIYDDRTYGEVFYNLGLVTKKQLETFEILRQNLYRKELQKPRCIVLNPGPEICWEHLQSETRKNGKQKFGQGDRNFLEAVCNEFEYLKLPKEIFYIDKRADDEVINEILKWI